MRAMATQLLTSAATGEVIYLTRGGHRPAAIVRVEVAAEVEAAEDAADIATAKAAMAEPSKDIPVEAVWAGLGAASCPPSLTGALGQSPPGGAHRG